MRDWVMLALLFVVLVLFQVAWQRFLCAQRRVISITVPLCFAVLCGWGATIIACAVIVVTYVPDIQQHTTVYAVWSAIFLAVAVVILSYGVSGVSVSRSEPRQARRDEAVIVDDDADDAVRGDLFSTATYQQWEQRDGELY